VDKKYLIVFVVSIVIAGGFFIFKTYKNKKDTSAHEEQQYSRMIEVANKSSIAGLSNMGMALNKYKDEKGSYPNNLSALYPDYIPVKAFIDDIQWYYEPRGEDFYLRKTVHTEDKKVLIAAIGSDLRPIEESMMASIDKQKRYPKQTEPETKPVKKVPEASITLASKNNPKHTTRTETTDPSATSRQTTIRKPSEPRESLTSPKSALNDSETLSTTKLSKEEQFVERVRGAFLVWKNDDGTLGFGNVQYPTLDKITIYDQGEWVQIRHRSPNSGTKMAALKSRKEKRPTLERLVVAGSGQFMVWKDPNGTIYASDGNYPND